ncbi:MAG: hypothetical protein ACI4DY_05105, partial [Monoglobaceae bacterium]
MVKYYKNGATSSSNLQSFTTQGVNTWNRVNFQLERVADASSTSGYIVHIKTLSFIDSAGNITHANTSGLDPVKVDWWSGSVKDSTITDASYIAMRISGNYGGKDENENVLIGKVDIDDVMVYEPEDLKM